MFLFTKNLTKNKLNTLFIEIFKIKKIKNITILLKLSNIKMFSKFHISLFKKISQKILITKT